MHMADWLSGTLCVLSMKALLLCGYCVASMACGTIVCLIYYHFIASQSVLGASCGIKNDIAHVS